MTESVQQKIGSVALVVEDYDEAIAFYTEKLQFILIEDTPLGDNKRWVLISPPNANGTNLLLAAASNEEQMKAKGVVFLEQPREEAYGTVVVFQDLYGNKWDLLQLNANNQG